MSKYKSMMAITMCLIMIVFTGCGSGSSTEKNDFLGKWEMQGTIADATEDDTDAAMLSLFSIALDKITDVNIDNMSYEIMKNGKVVAYLDGKKMSTEDYTLSDDGKSICIGESIGTLNEDKDILSIDGMDFFKVSD